MSFLTDLIKEKASEVLANKISIPEGIQEQVLGGVADSIFGSVKQTAGKEGGIDQLIELFTGREKGFFQPGSPIGKQHFRLRHCQEIRIVTNHCECYRSDDSRHYRKIHLQ